MSNNIVGVLEDLKNICLQYYQQNSIIEHVCEVNRVQTDNKANFEFFNSPAYIPRTIIDPNNFPINPVVDKILVNESSYIIEKIKEKSKKAQLSDNILDCIEREATNMLNELDVKAIIVPRGLYSQIPIWNNRLNPNVTNNLNTHLHLSVPREVRVVIPPHGIVFDNTIIISGKVSNHFDFISNDENRLEVGYNSPKGNQIPFWARIWCRFKVVDSDDNITIS